MISGTSKIWSKSGPVILLTITKNPFHVFNRYEIHSQAFANVFYGRILIFRSSSSQILITNEILKIHRTFKTNKHVDSHIYKHNNFPGCSHSFLVFFYFQVRDSLFFFIFKDGSLKFFIFKKGNHPTLISR